MLIKILIGLVVIVVVFAFVIALQPSEFRIVRSARTGAVGAFCLFMNMDKMVGGELEKGLAQMKAIAEAAASC